MSLLLLVVVAGCAGPGDCRLEVAAVLPARLLGNVPVVPVEINGQFAVLVLDTGANVTVLNRAAARRLGVADDASVRSVQGAGGAARVTAARVDRLSLGGTVLANKPVLLADLPAPPFDGLMGLDVLTGFELELDVPAGRATLYKVRRCVSAAPSWEGAVALPVQMQAGSGHLFVPVQVDRETFRGVLDTGSSFTTLSLQSAEDLRVDRRGLAGLPAARSQTLNAGGLVVRARPFERLAIGPAVLERPTLAIADLPAFAGDVLVGADVLATRPVWFQFLLGRVFLRDQPRPR